MSGLKTTTETMFIKFYGPDDSLENVMSEWHEHQITHN